MRLRSVWFLAVLPLSLLGATVTRTTKGSGTGDWATNETVEASEINGDFNAIVNEINGGLDNANFDGVPALSWSKIDSVGQVVDASVAAAANIALSKINDFSANSTELNTTFDASPSTLPTSALLEIEALRLAIQRLNGAKTDSTAATQVVEWHLPAARPFNLLTNGDFEDSADGAPATAPFGWSFTDVGGTYSTDDTDAVEGVGHELTVTSDNDGVTDDGVSQAINGLKGSRRYMVVVSAKAASSGVCQILTSGGATNVAATSNGTTYATLVDTFTTNASPGTITLTLTVNDDGAGSDVCSFDHAGLFIMEDDLEPVTQYLPVYKTGTGTGAIDNAYSTAELTATVTVPGPGYIIKVSGEVCGGNSGVGFFTLILQARITENVNGGGASEVAESVYHFNSVGGNDNIFSTVPVSFVQTNPTPGATYAYVLQAQDQSTDAVFGSDGGTSCGTTTKKLLAELLKVN